MRSKLLLLTVLLVGCGEYSQMPARLPPVSKKIVEKLAPVEQKTTFDPFDNQSIRSRAETVYYLIAEDGTTVEVDLKVYAKVRVGSEFASRDWKD